MFIPLGVRVATARKLQADLFISGTCRCIYQSICTRYGCVCLEHQRRDQCASEILAQTQNASDLIGGVKKVGNVNVDRAILDMTQAASVRDSLVLGKHVLNALGNINKLHKGKVDQAGFAVLKAPDIPSILVETAFISIPKKSACSQAVRFAARWPMPSLPGVKRYFASGAVLAQR